jgi:two-component system OmpR family sensor kinase
MVAGQQDALIILLRNLVDNAIKYTPAGGTVDIDLRVASPPQNAGRASC